MTQTQATADHYDVTGPMTLTAAGAAKIAARFPATREIAEGDRIYATETLAFVEDSGPERIVAGTEGTVVELTGDDRADLIVEWDSGYVTGVDSGSVAPV